VVDADAPKRAFWVHQLAEYVLGLALVSAGMQNPEPFWPVVAGGVVVVSAAIVTGPLAAWRTVSRPIHKWVDVGVMAGLVVIAVMPFLAIDNTSRLMMIGVAAVMFVIWTTTSFDTPAARARRGVPPARGESLGRTAGRLVNQTRAYARKQRGE
jgi:hypothetical protein